MGTGFRGYGGTVRQSAGREDSREESPFLSLLLPFLGLIFLCQGQILLSGSLWEASIVQYLMLKVTFPLRSMHPFQACLVSALPFSPLLLSSKDDIKAHQQHIFTLTNANHVYCLKAYLP